MQKMIDENIGEYNTMTLSGTGEVSAVPDTAVIRLGVQTTGDNLAVIQQDNANISQAILQGLEQLGITEIKTFQYTIDKQYDYENNVRIDKGYSVRNIFEIRTQQLDLVGEIIDTAVNNGANVVDLVTFEVSEPELYYNQALNLAIMNSIRKAIAIAENLGIDINPIPINIVENSFMPTPISQNFAMREGAAVTPIEPGTKQIVASVTSKFAY